MKRLLCALLCAAALAAAPAVLSAQDEREGPRMPEPELVTSSWKLTFSYNTPRTIAIREPDGSVSWYWYMTYEVLNDPRVLNNKREPILFVPEIVIADDQGGIVHANRGIPGSVFRTIKEQTGNDLLESPGSVPGMILPGEDFIKESVAIWRVSEDDVDEFSVFIGGIYGETAYMPHPVTGERMMRPVTNPRTGEPELDSAGEPMMRPVTLRRTRKLHFATPGTVTNPQRQSIRLLRAEDVMR